MKTNVIAYLRVSTSEQGKSGLGLDAQLSQIQQFCDSNNLAITQTFTEVGSGSSLIGRPIMQDVIKLSKKTKQPIVVSKGDRAFRKESDRLNVKESGITIINIQLGLNPDEMIEGIHGVFAEHERKLISKRTKDALKTKMMIDKEKGIAWWGMKTQKIAQKNGHLTQMNNANIFAKKMQLTINTFKNNGLSLNEIAKELNNTGVKTARNKEWSPQTVKNIISRLAIQN
jgi:DNA invertase Pin-like site-specific DNA recombinase